MPYIGPNSHNNLKKDKTPILFEQGSHGVTPSLRPLCANPNKKHPGVYLFLCIDQLWSRKDVSEKSKTLMAKKYGPRDENLN